MMSHEADYWRSKLIDQSFPLFGIAEREDYIAIGFLELNDLIHTRLMFSEYPEVILGEDCMIFPRCLAGLAIHQFSRAAQRGGSGRQDRTILTMRRRPLVNQEVRLRATFLG